MTKVLRALGESLAMGLAWGLGWAFIGGVIEIFEPDPAFIDVWVTTLGIPGFVGGVIFSLLLHSANGGRRLVDVAAGRSATFGALAGFLLALLIAGVTTWLGSPPGPGSVAVVAAVATALGAVSAAVLRVIVERLPLARRFGLT